MTRTEIDALLERHRAAFKRQDARALASDHAEQGTFESPAHGVVTGRSAIGDVYQYWFTAFPDLQITWDEALIDGDRAAVFWRFAGTSRGPFFGVVGAGSRVELRGAAEYRFADGAIQNVRHIYDFSSRQQREDFVIEYRIVRPDGGIRWVRGLGRTLLDGKGEAVRCVGFNYDITEEKKTEERIRSLQARLVEAVRANAMRTMAEKLAHELNQPLSAASNYLAGAKAGLEDLAGPRADHVREAFHRASTAVHSAAEVVRGLRALIRQRHASAGGADLEQAIRASLGLVMTGADEQGVRTTTDLAAGLLTPVDDLQVQQVVISLVRNALEAMEGCVDKSLDISCRRDADNALIRIQDSGAGICETQKHKLYEPFATSKPHAMGIGLAISRTIVEAHGGALWAEPLPTGTAFCFTLPLADAH